MVLLFRQGEVGSARDGDCGYDDKENNGKDSPGRKALSGERHWERSKGGKFLLDLITDVGVRRYITPLWTLTSDGGKQ